MILTRIWIIKTIEKPENTYDIISFNKKGLPLRVKENNATKIIIFQYIFVFGYILYVYFSFFIP